MPLAVLILNIQVMVIETKTSSNSKILDHI